MEVILVLLIVAILNGAVAFIDEMLSDLVPMTLHADQYMTGAGGGSMVDVLFEILLGFGVSLIILKFLKKGFECYVDRRRSGQRAGVPCDPIHPGGCRGGMLSGAVWVDG